MNKFKSILSALCIGLIAAATPAVAAEAGPQIKKEPWSFAGLFGTYDQNQLQRGFQVFREVCASCHGARLIAFRNLSEPGGPGFTEGQVKALAAEYEIADLEAEGGVRQAVPADRWPSPFANDIEAAEANGGVAPPDLSVIAKARNTSQPFPWWLLNYVTPYAEGGPDYLHALLTGYEETPPEGSGVPEGKYYNHYFPGHAIGMPPPLSDGLVTYAEAENGTSVPLTVDQYSRDFSAFAMWMAEPHLVARKESGLQVMVFLLAFAGIMYLVKRKLWSKVEH